MISNSLVPYGYYGNQWRWRPVSSNTYFGNLLLNSKTPVWVDLVNLRKPYDDCPHLNITVNRGAEMFSNGRWKCVDVNNEDQEYPNDPALILLKKPNPVQNSKNWLAQYYVYRAVWANNFIYKLYGSKLLLGALPRCLWHLPSEFMQINPTGKVFDQYELKGVIEKFALRWVGTIGSEDFQVFYPVDEVIFKAYNPSPIKGRSKIEGLVKPISNIIAGLQSRNIITTELGTKGILSSSTKDSEGGIPLNPQERQRIESQFKKDRGLDSDRSHVIITNAALSYQTMSYPAKDLMILEGNEADAGLIYDAYNLDRDIFCSTKGATYENKSMGQKISYNDGIIPVAEDLAETMTIELGVDTRGRKLILDYSHLPVMKEDAESEGKGKLYFVQAAHQLYMDGVIDAQGYADMTGEEMTGEGKPLPIEAKPTTENAPVNQN